jgi:hypothetical protein
MLPTAQVAKSGLAALTGFTGRSACNDAGSVEVGVRLVSAGDAAECRLAGPVLFGDVPASPAFPRRVARIDENERHSRQCGFVGDKHPQLVERPTVENHSLPAPNSYPVANPTQVFELDSACGAFSAGNDLLTDNVVDVAGKAGLPAREKFEPTLGRSGSLTLQLRTQPAVAIADALDLRTRVLSTVGIRGDVRDSKIDAKERGSLKQCRLWHIARGNEIERAILIDQVRLATLAHEQHELLPPASGEADVQPTIQAADRDGHPIHIPAKDAAIVGDGTMRAKGALRLPVELVSVGNLGDAAHRDLGRKSEVVAKTLVDQRLNAVAIELLRLPRLLGNPGAGKIGAPGRSI